MKIMANVEKNRSLLQLRIWFLLLLGAILLSNGDGDAGDTDVEDADGETQSEEDAEQADDEKHNPYETDDT